MASLSTEPGSSRPKQRQRLHQLKRRLGWSDDELHDAIGEESTTMLSAAQASDFIERLGGGELPNAPGQKPAPYAGKRKTTDATRVIHPDHVEQIERLLGEYFDDEAAGLAWLEQNFDARHPCDLLTAKRAGQVIHVLKDMIARREAGQASDNATGNGGRDDTGSDHRWKLVHRFRELCEQNPDVPRKAHADRLGVSVRSLQIWSRRIGQGRIERYADNLDALESVCPRSPV